MFMLDFLGQSEAVGAWNNLGRESEKAFSSSKPAMDYSSSAYVDTSLDLNSKPLRLLDDTPNRNNKEVQSKFIDFGKKLSAKGKDETGALVEELGRVSAENKKLTEMLTVMCENYNNLRNQMVEYMNKTQPEKELSPSKKRKSESSNNNIVANNNGNSESSSTDEESFKKPREEAIKTKIWKSCVKTEASDTTLIVRDGYQWRKYGQKVTRDNPSPRAYFKCSFAPGCPVKKKVQRSVEDQTILVATYEGEHNHPQPSQLEATSGSNRAATSVATSLPVVTLDFAKPKSSSNETKPAKPVKVDSPEVRQFLVEQMASSLTKDPNFTAALAAAISGRMYEHRNPTEKW